MSRSQRLFDLLQILRCYKYPVSACDLAEKLKVSIRTIYRDIATLQAQGADIEGEAGLGYVLKANFFLPPLMFTLEELEIIQLGVEWASKQANGEFSSVAKNALAKLSAVLPPDHPAKYNHEIMRVASIIEVPELEFSLSDIRTAIKQQFKMEIDYLDEDENRSQRIVWPILIGFFQQFYLLVAWCEVRKDYRNFRLDRIKNFKISGNKYLKSRRELLAGWRNLEGINNQITY